MKKYKNWQIYQLYVKKSWGNSKSKRKHFQFSERSMYKELTIWHHRWFNRGLGIFVGGQGNSEIGSLGQDGPELRGTVEVFMVNMNWGDEYNSCVKVWKLEGTKQPCSSKSLFQLSIIWLTRQWILFTATDSQLKVAEPWNSCYLLKVPATCLFI